MYAFCNTHDITWGTKGDDKAEKLPSATLKPGGKVDVNIPQDDGDLNDQYDAEMKVISAKAAKEQKVVGAAEKQEDYYKGFRSAVVLVWMFSNLALAAVVLTTAGLDRVTVENSTTDRAAIYMGVVLWSVAGLSLFRFCGAMWFLVVRLVSFPLSLDLCLVHTRHHIRKENGILSLGALSSSGVFEDWTRTILATGSHFHSAKGLCHGVFLCVFLLCGNIPCMH